MESITDLAYVDGKVFVAGLSNEEFASNLRAINFPSTTSARGEHRDLPRRPWQTGNACTRANLRSVQDRWPRLFGGCIHLHTVVKIPVSDLKPGSKVSAPPLRNWQSKQTTGHGGLQERWQELHSHGQQFTRCHEDCHDTIKDQASIARRSMAKPPACPMKRCESLTGVTQLDRLSDTLAVVLIKTPRRLGDAQEHRPSLSTSQHARVLGCSLRGSTFMRVCLVSCAVWWFLAGACCLAQSTSPTATTAPSSTTQDSTTQTSIKVTLVQPESDASGFSENAPRHPRALIRVNRSTRINLARSELYRPRLVGQSTVVC